MALAINELGEADVGDAGSVLSNQVDVGIQDCGVDRLTVLRQEVLKVESVEVHSLHQVAQGLRFKGGQTRITDLSVCLEVSIVDSLDQLFSDLDDLLFACFDIFVLHSVAAVR